MKTAATGTNAGFRQDEWICIRNIGVMTLWNKTTGGKKGKSWQRYTSYGALCLYIAFGMSSLTCGIPISVKYRSPGTLRGENKKEMYILWLHYALEAVFFHLIGCFKGRKSLHNETGTAVSLKTTRITGYLHWTTAITVITVLFECLSGIIQTKSYVSSSSRSVR